MQHDRNPHAGVEGDQAAALADLAVDVGEAAQQLAIDLGTVLDGEDLGAGETLTERREAYRTTLAAFDAALADATREVGE